MNFIFKMYFPVILLLIQFLSILYAYPVEYMKPKSKSPRNNVIFDGDIVLRNQSLFNTIDDKIELWHHRIIPYEINPELSGEKYLIEESIRYFNEKTCIHFTPRREEFNYVYITTREEDVCQSNVGMEGKGRQDLVLGPKCRNVGTILHELMHVIGFYHEHNRSDRDQYLKIHYHNIKHGMEKNFIKLSPKLDPLLEPFDYQSITIYGEFSFSKNGLRTMTALTGELITDPHYKTSLTHTDLRAINKLYDC